MRHQGGRIALVALALWVGANSPGQAATVTLSGTWGQFTIDTLTIIDAGAGGLFGFDTVAWTGSGEAVEPYDLDFAVSGLEPSGWAWLAFDIQMQNDSPQIWKDFHLSLGHAMGDEHLSSCECDTTFILSDPVPGDVAAFFYLNPSNPYDEPDGPDLVNFLGTLAPGGGTAHFTFAVRVADAFDGVPGDGNTRFTLRVTPSVPEPSSLVLLTLAAGLVGLARPRRR